MSACRRIDYCFSPCLFWMRERVGYYCVIRYYVMYNIIKERSDLVCYCQSVANCPVILCCFLYFVPLIHEPLPTNEYIYVEIETQTMRA